MPIDVQQLYGAIWNGLEDPIDARLGTSLQPRSPEMLYDCFATFDPQAGDLVLDLGGRNAVYAVELARRFGVRVIMVDPVPEHLIEAEPIISESGVADLVSAELGDATALRFDEDTFDHIWCRDVLVHVDHRKSLAECFRVLKPGGKLLVYQTFGTDLLEPAERARLIRAMAIVPSSLKQPNFEAAAAAASFRITGKEELRSEWREYWAEQGTDHLLDDTLRLSRINRDWDAMVAEYGVETCEAVRAGASWGLLQFLGKTMPTIYLLEKPE